MKRIKILYAIPMAALLFGCNNEASKEEAKTADTAAAASAPAAPEKPAFKPYKILAIQLKVKNFSKWQERYFADDSLRKAYGISHAVIGRDLKDSNKVYVLDKIEDFDKARAYSKLPMLNEASKKSTLVGSLGFSYGEIIRSNDESVASAEHLGVAHHVKNFETWVKAFDADAGQRASNGIIDLSIARDLVDSNMVYLSFAVSDMAKAKAKMESPELKKIMNDAGVDSAPTVRWFRFVK
ncbi:MAG: hypothetical protein ACHQEM_12470 [Chitinophagales bacterium]